MVKINSIPVWDAVFVGEIYFLCYNTCTKDCQNYAKEDYYASRGLFKR